MDKHPGKDRHGSSWRDGCGQACLGFCRVSAAATRCSDLPRVPGKPLTPCVLYQLLPFPKCWLPAGERIRITEHPLEIHLLFAVWTRLLLPDNAPAPDAELMKPGEWHVKGNWKKRGIHGSVWRKPPSPRKSFQDYGNILPCEDGALNNHNPFLEGAAASRDSERSSWSQTPLSCSRQSRRRGKSQNLQLRLPLVGYWGELVLQDCSPGMSLGRSGAWSLEKNGGIQTSRGLYPAIFPSV